MKTSTKTPDASPRLTSRWLTALLTAGALAGLGLVNTPTGAPLGLGAAHAQANELNAEALTDKVQKFYTEMKDFQARFEQIYTDQAAGKETSSGGRVFFKKPGKMRWDYLTADKKLQKVLVSNGADFTIYEAEHNQFYRQSLGDSKLPTALRFLMGDGDIKVEFNAALKPKSNNGDLRLELTPKKDEGKYKKLVFVVDPATYSVKETIVYDPYGNTNRIVFHKPLLNKSLPDSGFDFSPPKDATQLGPGRD